jgi:LacI family transcriptional regulator
LAELQRSLHGRLTTLADVANAAGVSLATASKALSDRYDVAASTKERVKAVAKELRFTPNHLARGLLSGRTESVGIITSDLDARFAPQIMMGAEDALGADRSSVLLCNSRGNPELERHHIQELLRRRVDGLIVVGDSPEPREPLDPAPPIPTVYVYAPSNEPDDLSFVCDNVHSARLATNYLIEQGRRRLVHLGGPAGSTAARDRADGTQAAARDAGLELLGGGPLLGDWQEIWGWQAVDRLLHDGVEFDGLVCGNDQIGRGALDQLDRRGIEVPDAVEVIGFDNWSILSRDTRRPFPSIDLDLAALGHAAAQALTRPGQTKSGTHAIPGFVATRPYA